MMFLVFLTVSGGQLKGDTFLLSVSSLEVKGQTQLILVTDHCITGWGLIRLM